MGATLTENVVVSIIAAATISISVNEAVGTAEASTASVASASTIEISVVETPSVSDVITVTREDATTFTISVNDGVGVADVVTEISVSEIDVTSININDGISIAEDVSLAIELVPSIVDTVGIAEDVTLSIGSAGGLEPSVVDNISASEDITLSVSSANDINISIIDAVSVAEDNTVTLGVTADVGISVVDAIGVAENVSTSIDSASDMDVWATTIEMDGNDTYDLPVPTHAQIQADWDVELDFLFTSVIKTDLWSVWQSLFGANDPSIYFTVADNGDTTSTVRFAIKEQLGSYVYVDLAPITVASKWVNFRVSNTSGTLLVVATVEGEAPVEATGSMPTGDFSTLDNGLLFLHPFPTNGRPADNTKMKNLRGSWWETGEAFADIGQTVYADIGDKVASFTNNGIVGGAIERSSTAGQSILDSLTPSEAVGVAENVSILFKEIFISVSEAVSTAEDISVSFTYDALLVDIVESITATEFTSQAIYLDSEVQTETVSMYSPMATTGSYYSPIATSISLHSPIETITGGLQVVSLTSSLL